MAIYQAKLHSAKDGGFWVEFPGLPGAVTQGESKEEALSMAEDCLRTYFLGLITIGQDVPEPQPVRTGRAVHSIALPALESAKVELYRSFRASGLGKGQLARRIGISVSQLDRLFDLDHPSPLDQIEAALLVLGKRLVVAVRDAA